jgi:hypothetical protein
MDPETTMPTLTTISTHANRPIKSDKEMWAYAYENGTGLSINRTTHFASYLKHSPSLWENNLKQRLRCARQQGLNHSRH